MENPTLVLLTDRNDLVRSALWPVPALLSDLLGQTPVQADSRERCANAGRGERRGGVYDNPEVFFAEKGDRMPALTPRRNIIVIADEAHRSQYDLIDGSRATCAMRCRMPRSLVSLERPSRRRMPTRGRSLATTSAFTTYSAPLPTRLTVPIYYESRIAKLRLNAAELADDRRGVSRKITEGEELTRKEKLKASGLRWRLWWAIRNALR
jgi:type I restriction enzyme R subunit